MQCGCPSNHNNTARFHDAETKLDEKWNEPVAQRAMKVCVCCRTVSVCWRLTGRRDRRRSTKSCGVIAHMSYLRTCKTNISHSCHQPHTIANCKVSNHPREKIPTWLPSVLMPSVLWHCWLGVGKSIRPVKNWVMGYWHGYLSGVWCKWFAYGPVDAAATPSSLASVKSRMVYLSGAGLPRLSWKKGR